MGQIGKPKRIIQVDPEPKRTTKPSDPSKRSKKPRRKKEPVKQADPATLMEYRSD